MGTGDMVPVPAEELDELRRKAGIVDRRNIKNKKRKKWRYHNDPEHREKMKEESRKRLMERYNSDPVFRGRIRRQQKEKYASDPMFRERVKENTRKYREKIRREKEKGKQKT